MNDIASFNARANVLRASQTWPYVKDELEREIARLQLALEAPGSEVNTAMLRGELRAMRRLLAMDTPKHVEDSGPGVMP